MSENGNWWKPHHVVKRDNRGNEEVVAQFPDKIQSDGYAMQWGLAIDQKNQYTSHQGVAEVSVKKPFWGGGGKYEVTEHKANGETVSNGIYGDKTRADIVIRGHKMHAEDCNTGNRYTLKKR